MNTELAYKVDRQLVDFLVRNGGLPILHKSSRKVEEAQEKIHRKLKRMFAGAEQDLIDELKKHNYAADANISRSQFANIIEDYFNDVPDELAAAVEEVINHGRRSAISQLQQAGMKVGFDDFDALTARQIKDQVKSLMENVVENIAEDVSEVVKQGYEDGLGIDAIASRMRDKAKDIRHNRLKTIARTEVNSAQNQGKEETMEELGVEFKQWLTGEDEKVRGLDEHDEYDHVMMHGQVVMVGEDFKHPEQGWELKYPGDKGGDAGNIINCRCTERPYIPEPDEIETILAEISRHGYSYPAAA